MRNIANVQEVLRRNGATDYGQHLIDRILLKKSVLSPSGPTYSTVTEAPLRKVLDHEGESLLAFPTFASRDSSSRSTRSMTSIALQSAGAFLRRGSWMVNISSWALLVIAATVLVFFFRFHQTTSVPPEPFSDHAEKILDVYDVSQGQTHIFFTRNTGREAIQMYWTLLVANVFGTGFSYLSLKLGTAILGFLTLPFIYLLGKEIGGNRVGLFAFLLAGIGYWPNIISRVGLRFPLYPIFAAPTLFFLIRGLRTRNRNDFLLSGLFLGIG